MPRRPADRSGICDDCKEFFPFLQKAHIVAKHKGGTNDPSNIIRICPNCHSIRDHDDRVAWVKKRWEELPPEERSKQQQERMAALPDEVKTSRAQKISASKMGKKHPEGHKTGGARELTPEQLETRAASVRATYDKWTPEQRAVHSAKIKAGKAKKRETADESVATG